jgi:hypothetical protein
MSELEVQEPPAVVEETALPAAEVPGAPETVSAGAEPDSTEPPVSDRPRDTQGRFMKRDGSPVAPDEQARLEAAATPVPATPTTPPAPAPPVVPAGEPFVFRAEGQKIPIPGASLSDQGLHVPIDQVPAIRQLLAEGMAHRGSWRQKEAEFNRRIEEASTVEKARADRYNAAAVFLFDKVNDPTWLQQLVNDPERELGLLRRELGLELKTREMQAPKAQTPAAPQPQEVDEAQLTQAFSAALLDEVDELLEDPRYKGLFSPEDIKELKDDYTARMAAYAHVDNGQYFVDRETVKRAFDREVKTQQRIKQAAAEAQKAREFNEKRNAPAAPIVPVVSTKGSGGNGSGAKVYKNRDEWRKAMRLD